MGSSLVRVPFSGLGFLGFRVPNIVRHPCNRDPETNPNLENDPSASRFQSECEVRFGYRVQEGATKAKMSYQFSVSLCLRHNLVYKGVYLKL